ncbi:MAG: hypothetical protein EB116_10775 [Betaproteobacteria bacterium]|nr:hypothetical protein [Betaproteobacteria bacterium]
MAQMLLINPRRRSARKSNPVARRRRKNPVSLYAKRRRRHNPVSGVARRMRRRNPASLARRRVMRRRNPIGMGSMNLMGQIREAFIGGAGAVTYDIIQGYLNKVLPINLQVVPGKVGVGDAVKAVTTVAIGHFLARPTKGLSRKLAAGALTVQMAGIMRQFIPTGMAMGYYVPGAISQGSQRVSPINRAGMGAYTKGTPLLSAYTSGQSPLLSRVMNARQREGITIR